MGGQRLDIANPGRCVGGWAGDRPDVVVAPTGDAHLDGRRRLSPGGLALPAAAARFLSAMAVTYVDRVPTPQEHRGLAERVGWADAFRWDAIPASLAGSCCGVVALDEQGRVVGMGRAVGDGAFFFYLQDIAVDPAHRGMGIGRAITGRLIDQVQGIAGGDAFIGLFATDEAVSLYRGAGFDDTSMHGMWQVVRPGPGR